MHEHLNFRLKSDNTKSLSRQASNLFTVSNVAWMVSEPLFWFLGMRAERQEINLKLVKRILVVRLDEIGDVVMTTPFLRELRHNFPNARITLVVNPTIHNLMEFCPYVNEVLVYDWKTHRHFLQLTRHKRAITLAWKYLWSRRFDLAILPRWDTDYYHAAFLLYFSGAMWRIGYAENVTECKQHLNRGFNRLFTNLIENNTVKHEVEHNLDIIRSIGGTVHSDHLELWIGEEDELFADRILKSCVDNRNTLLIALTPGAGAPHRMWPISNFVELGTILKKKYHTRIIVIGGDGDKLLVQELQQQLGDVIVNVVGQTTLRHLAALLKRCHLYVGNDAGPMHIAAVMGVPVIEISCHPVNGSSSHPNSPKRFGPWGVKCIILQPEKPYEPCCDACNSNKAHCILGITVKQVEEAVEKLIPC